MKVELQGPKEEVRKRYNSLLGSEQYEDVKVVEPLQQMPDSNCGYWKMLVEAKPAFSFTSRGIYGG